jgi:hypothetical protein
MYSVKENTTSMFAPYHLKQVTTRSHIQCNSHFRKFLLMLHLGNQPHLTWRYHILRSSTIPHGYPYKRLDETRVILRNWRPCFAILARSICFLYAAPWLHRKEEWAFMNISKASCNWSKPHERSLSFHIWLSKEYIRASIYFKYTCSMSFLPTMRNI